MAIRWTPTIKLLGNDIQQKFNTPYETSDNGAGNGTLLQPGHFNIADISMTTPQGGITVSSTDTMNVAVEATNLLLFDTYTNFPLYISDSSAQYWRINISLSGKTSNSLIFGVYPVIILNNVNKFSSVFNSDTPYTIFSLPAGEVNLFSASFTDIVHFDGLNAYLTTGQPSVPIRVTLKLHSIYGEPQAFDITSLNVQYTLEPVSRT